MAARSGLGSQIGFKTETTWGTAVTPDTFLPYTSEDIKYSQNYIRSAGLQAGVISQVGALHVATTHNVGGSLNLDVTRFGFGKLFNLLHGNTVTPSTPGGATNARLQTHAIGTTTPSGKGITLQVGRPDVGGTVRPFTYSGVKVRSVTFNIEKDGILTSTWDLVGKDESTATSLATASYTASNLPFNFTWGTVEFADTLLTDVVSSGSVTVTIPMADDRASLGSTTIAEPIVNNLVTVTANLELEFASLTQHTAFTAATRRKFELNFNSTDYIESTTPYSLYFVLPSTVTTDASPVVTGPDIVRQSVTLEATYDGTNAPLSILYENTETTI